MVLTFLTDEILFTVSPEKFWKASVLDIVDLMPKLSPAYKGSVEIVQGDGGVGTIKVFHLPKVPGAAKSLKDRIDVMDNENLRLKVTAIEGGHIGPSLKSYSAGYKLEPSCNGGFIMKLEMEYETADDEPINEEEKVQIKQRFVDMSKAMETYLVANPAAYA